MLKKLKMFLPIQLLVLIWASQVGSKGIETERGLLLNDGNEMPAVGLGTYIIELTDRNYLREAIIWAIEAGCRLIDTAAIYATEDIVAEAIINVTKRGIVTREEMFISTKLPLKVGTRRQVVPAIKDSLIRLQLDYVDLMLIHVPYNVLGVKNYDYLEIWKGLEDARSMGYVKSIGVSNFNSTQVNKILTYSKIPPAVNQIEVNPTFTNLELVAYCQSLGIVVTAYAPFGFLVRRTFNDLALPPSFNDPLLVQLAIKYGVTTSQIALRYLIDRDLVIIPQSLNQQHIESNINIFDFSLSVKEVRMINEFDKNIKVYLGDIETLFTEAGIAIYLKAKEYVFRNRLKVLYSAF